MDVLARISKAIGRPLPALQADSEGQGEASTSSRGQSGEPSQQQGRQKISQSQRKSAQKAEREAQRAFLDNWQAIRSALTTPDQAALHHGIARTNLKPRLEALCDALVYEANRASTEAEVAGPCMETLLEADILGHLVRLTANDRIAGSQAQVVRLFSDLTILLDERFLSRQAVHRPLVRLLRVCVGDDSSNTASTEASTHALGNISDGKADDESAARRRFGRGGSAEILGFEEDLVNLLCHVASRLRNTPDLLIIFFREKSTDEETRRAFNKAMAGSSASSTSTSRTSTRPSSPNSLSPNFKAGTVPAVSSPLRPIDASLMPTSPRGPGRSTAIPPADSTASAQASLPFDFPLFSYLMRFVHRESRTGELARAGLLFLIDVAFAPGRRNLSSSRRSVLRTTARDATSAKQGRRPSAIKAKPSIARINQSLGLGPSTALARLIVDSDFSEVLGASVGAVYGLLPTKLALSIKTSNKDGMSLGEGRSADPVRDIIGREIEANDGDNVRTQARLLCDLVEFVQDIMRTASRLVPGMPLIEYGNTQGSAPTVSVELATAGHTLVASICDHVQALFLESILYPSMLECSDSDGSAVAVLTYVDAVMSVLEDDSPFADCIIGWLVGIDARSARGRANSSISVGSMQKPKTYRSRAMLQLEKESASRSLSRGTTYYSDALGRYTVRDLLLDNIRPSASPMSAVAALRLMSTVLTYHGLHSINGVLKVVTQEHATAFPAILAAIDGISDQHNGQHNDDQKDDEDADNVVYSKEATASDGERLLLSRRILSSSSAWQYTAEMELYLSLIGEIERCAKSRSDGEKDDDHTGRSTGFENYIEDAEKAILLDSMFRTALSAHVEADSSSAHLLGHNIATSDRLVRTALQSLCCFWRNAPDVNVSLMGLFAALAACPVRSLGGLITFARDQESALMSLQDTAQASQHVDNDDDDRSDDERAFAEKTEGRRADRKKADLSSLRAPVVASVIRALLDQLQAQRSKIRDFDRYLAERRRGLLFIENLDEAIKASNIDDEEKSSLQDDAGAPFDAMRLPAKEAKRLWDWVDAAKQTTQSTDVTQTPSPTHVSLPEPPSATPSQGMADDTNAEERAPTPTGRAVEQVAQDSASGEEAKDPNKEPSTFARLFGRARHSRGASLAMGRNRNDADSKAEKGEPPAPKPFAQHYLETSSVLVDVGEIELARSCPWSVQYDASLAAATSRLQQGLPESLGAEDMRDASASATVKRTRFLDFASSGTIAGNDDVTVDGDDSFVYPGQDDDKSSSKTPGSQPKPRSSSASPPVFLSTLLDNVVILEESIKELVAILHVRRALGIDPVSFM